MDCHFYSVTKFILRAMGDGLRMEFRANNIPIRVSVSFYDFHLFSNANNLHFYFMTQHIGPGHVLTGAQDRGESKTSDIYEGFLVNFLIIFSFTFFFSITFKYLIRNLLKCTIWRGTLSQEKCLLIAQAIKSIPPVFYP